MADVTREWLIRIRENGGKETLGVVNQVRGAVAQGREEVQKSSTVVDEHGRVMGFTRGELRKYNQEQRLQNVLFREVRQVATAASVAVLAVSSSFGESRKETRAATQALLTAISVFQAVEFTAFAMGRSLGPIGMILAGIAAVGLGFVTFMKATEEGGDRAKKTIDALATSIAKLPLTEQEKLLDRIGAQLDTLNAERFATNIRLLIQQDVQVQRITEGYKKLDEQFGLTSRTVETALIPAQSRSIEQIAKDIGVRDELAKKLKDELEVRRLVAAVTKELGIVTDEDRAKALKEIELRQEQNRLDFVFFQNRLKFLRQLRTEQAPLPPLSFVIGGLGTEDARRIRGDIERTRREALSFSIAGERQLLENAIREQRDDIIRLENEGLISHEEAEKAKTNLTLVESNKRLALLRREYRELDALGLATADVLQANMGEAWNDIMGEANSLFEQMMVNWARRLADIFLEEFGLILLKFAGTFLGSGAGTEVTGLELGGRAGEGESLPVIQINVDARSTVGSWREVERALMNRNVQRAIVHTLEDAVDKRRTS